MFCTLILENETGQQIDLSRTAMLAQLSEIQEQMKNFNTTVSQLQTKINELTVKIDEITGDVVSIGKSRQNVNFVLYSDGKLLLRDTKGNV